KARVARGEPVLVVGQGPIGLLLMQICRWAGADVFTSDALPDRLEMSRRLGATTALEAGPAVPGEVRASTSGRGVEVAFVAALGQEPLTQAIASTRPGGRIMVFAATSP